MNLWCWNWLCFVETVELLIYWDIEVAEATILEKYTAACREELQTVVLQLAFPKGKCMES